MPGAEKRVNGTGPVCAIDPRSAGFEVASRAALQHQSMQEYLRGELERIASRPSLETWLKTVRKRKATGGTRIPAKKIVNARDADRK